MSGYSDFIDRINHLLNISRKYQLNHVIQQIIGLKEKIHQRPKVLIVGEFSTGKSSFINALIDEELLVTKSVVATSIPTYLSYGEHYKYSVYYYDGKVEHFDKADLTKFTIENNDEAQSQIEKVVIEAPIEMLNHVTLIDSPGLNATNRQHTYRTYDLYKEVNNIFFLVSSDKIASESIINELKNLKKTGNNVFLIVNKIDLLYEELELDDGVEETDEIMIEEIEKYLEAYSDNFSPYVTKILPFSAEQHFIKDFEIFEKWATVSPIKSELIEISNTFENKLFNVFDELTALSREVLKTISKIHQLPEENKVIKELNSGYFNTAYKDSLKWVNDIKDYINLTTSIKEEEYLIEVINRFRQLKKNVDLKFVNQIKYIDNLFSRKNGIELSQINLQKEFEEILEFGKSRVRDKKIYKYNKAYRNLKKRIKYWNKLYKKLNIKEVKESIIDQINIVISIFHTQLHKEKNDLNKMKEKYQELIAYRSNRIEDFHEVIDSLTSLYETAMDCHELFHSENKELYKEIEDIKFKNIQKIKSNDKLIKTMDEKIERLYQFINQNEEILSPLKDMKKEDLSLLHVKDKENLIKIDIEKISFVKTRMFSFSLSMIVFSTIIYLIVVYQKNQSPSELVFDEDYEFMEEVDEMSGGMSTSLDTVYLEPNFDQEPIGFLVSNDNIIDYYDNEIIAFKDTDKAILEPLEVYFVLEETEEKYRLTHDYWIMKEDITYYELEYYPRYITNYDEENPIGEINISENAMIEVVYNQDDNDVQGMAIHQQTLPVYEIDSVNNYYRIAENDWIASHWSGLTYNEYLDYIKVTNEDMKDALSFLKIEEGEDDLIVYDDQDLLNGVGKLKNEIIYPVSSTSDTIIEISDVYHIDIDDLDFRKHETYKRYEQHEPNPIYKGYSYGSVQIKSELIHIRSGPSENYDITALGVQGDKYDVLNIDNETGWYQLGDDYWITNHEDIVDFEQPFVEAVTPSNTDSDNHIGYILFLDEHDKDILVLDEPRSKAVVGKLDRTTAYPVLSKESGYYQIDTDMWVSERSIDTKKAKYFEKYEAKNNPNEEAIGEARITVEAINVRNGASKKSDVVGVSYKGEKFDVYETKHDGEWLRISKEHWITGKKEFLDYYSY